MQRTSLTTLLAFLLICCHADAQELVWQKWFGGGGVEDGTGILQTGDGGFLLAGYTTSFQNVPTAYRSGYLVRTDPDGGVMWEKVIGRYLMVTPRSLFANTDGSYTVIGEGVQEEGSRSRIYMARIDADGNPLWEKLLGDSVDGVGAFFARRLSNGDFALVGEYYGTPVGRAGLYLTRLTKQGTVAWSKTYSIRSLGRDVRVRELRDGGLVIVGNAHHPPAIDHDVALLKTSALGDSLWFRTYGTSLIEIGRDVVELADGNLLVYGHSHPNSRQWEGHLYMVRTDASGDTIASSRLTRSQSLDILSVESTSDGGFILAGSLGESSMMRTYFIKQDSQGNVQWEAGFTSGAVRHDGKAVLQLADGGFAAVGRRGTDMLITRITPPVSAVTIWRDRPTVLDLR